ncbi:unnamed protein product [marine sediment metagenome]|uniref:Uncharacterized protein n=1 Tax=marine sediment metagenome TaxID=412755 RepID=X1S9D9_9ZZZZ
MAWGGSLNEEGSDHLRNLREADKVIKFLEKFKEDLNDNEKKLISNAIEIIVEHFTKNS